MTHVRIKGFQLFVDRHGKKRCYHRKTRTPIDLQKCPLGSPEFFAECERIRIKHETLQPKPGTLQLLIHEYKVSPAFTDLADRTRKDYTRCLDWLRPLYPLPLRDFDRPSIVKIRDKAVQKHGRRFGNYVKAVLSIVFAWGVERGYLDSNPAAEIKNVRRPRGSDTANRPWLDYERAAALTLPDHIRLPIAIMMFTGIDPQDALLLPRQAIKDRMLDTRRGKTSQPVWVPLPAPLISELARAPVHSATTVCANTRGIPWTVSGFRASWRKERMKLEQDGKVQPGLTLKGLRHTVATILAEMGYDPRTIADMLGQKTIAMAEHYSRRADRTRKMTQVVENFDAELRRREALSDNGD